MDKNRPGLKQFFPDYAIGFPLFSGRDAITKKSGWLETLVKHRYGEIEKSNEVAYFEGILASNRRSIA
ncbi:hypothetical protein Q4534_05060 [Cyclobacterium sp. 1_MG-2023]|nr:hypothetical protein [Cyclobacterium sp. 1_MG-2023]